MASKADHERVLSLLYYNPETGVFLWRKTVTGHIRAGRMAGSSKDDGRQVIRIDRKRYLSHRLAWFYMHGEWPKHEIDHIDGNNRNNAICNLRDVSKIVNMQNRRKAASHNSSGLIGAHYHKKDKRWRARIAVDGKSIHLGNFKTPDAAHEAYLIAKRKLHEGCTI